MEEFDSKVNAWLRDYLIPRLANIFGERCNSSDIKYAVTKPRGSFYVSDLFLASIRFPRQEKHIVVKLPSQIPRVRKFHNCDQLFPNEILFYEKLAKRESTEYPKCYHCEHDKNKSLGFDYVIVLENVCEQGFFTCEKKINVHLNYIASGLKAVAKFHGYTYTIKEKSPNRFREIVKNIINVRYDENSLHTAFQENVNIQLKRVTRKLHESSYDPEFSKKINYLFDDGYTNLRKIVKPVEPLATIIHGDLTINNVLFRKFRTGQDERLETILIDFATIMYTSPAIDIATYIYMTLSRADIREYSEELVKYYHDCLSQYLKEQGIWNATKYSYDAFWKDYRRRAIFGYIIAAHFLAMMTEYEKNNDILCSDDETILMINRRGGGEPLSHLLVDMLIDMREAGLLDYYVNNNIADRRDV